MKNSFAKGLGEQEALEVSVGRLLPKAQIGCCLRAAPREGAGWAAGAEGMVHASCSPLLLLAALVRGWKLGTKVLLGWEQLCQWGSGGVLPYKGERRRSGGVVAHHIGLVVLEMK